MTTILKQMGIQSWRVKSLGTDSTLSDALTPVISMDPSAQTEDINSQAGGSADDLVSKNYGVGHEPNNQSQLDSLASSEHREIESLAAVPALNKRSQEALQASEHPSSIVSLPEPSAMPPTNADMQAEPSNPVNVPVDPLMSLTWQGLQTLIDGQNQCHTCGAENSNLGSGDHNARYLFVSDAPTRSDLDLGQLFTGRAGQLYEAMLLAIGLERASVYTTSVFKCVASDDLSAVPNCDKLLHRQIELVRPKVIVAFGEFAAQSVAKSNENLASLRERKLRCHRTKVPIVVSYSPLQLLDEPSLKAGAWRDLKKCIAITS